MEDGVTGRDRGKGRGWEGIGRKRKRREGNRKPQIHIFGYVTDYYRGY